MLDYLHHQNVFSPIIHFASLVVPLSSQLLQDLMYTISAGVELICTVPLLTFS